MPRPGWMFILTDIQGGVQGELTNASRRQVVESIKGIPTCTMAIKTSHPMAFLFEDPNQDLLIKGYRNGVLKFCGPVVSTQEVGGEGAADAIQINASGPFWRLNYRLAGVPLTNPGTVLVYQDGTPTPLRVHLLAQNLLTYANNQGYTGISAGSATSSLDGSVGPLMLQPIGDAITTLATTGFEWEVAPTEPTNVGQAFPQIGLFNCADLISTVRNNVVFEYGDGAANVLNYSNAIDRQGLLTLGYITQPAATDNSGVISYEDSAATATRGRYIGVVDNGGVQWDNYRTALLMKNIAVRARGRQILGFTPRPTAAFQPSVDYFLGDQVRCRVTKDRKFKFDAMFRIWGIQYDISEEGLETPTLITVPS